MLETNAYPLRASIHPSRARKGHANVMTAVEPPETPLFALKQAGGSRKGKVVGILDAAPDFTIQWAFDRCTSRADARVQFADMKPPPRMQWPTSLRACQRLTCR
jgi:hypothetical protein